MALKRAPTNPKLMPASHPKRRDAFRRELENRLRGLSDPLEIMACAAERLGTYLRASRCGYAETDATGEFLTIASDWTEADESLIHKVADRTWATISVPAQ